MKIIKPLIMSTKPVPFANETEISDTISEISTVEPTIELAPEVVEALPLEEPTPAVTVTPTANAIEIAVFNKSTKVTDAEVIKVMNALQVQITRDFYPIWGLDASLTFYATGDKVPGAAWWLVFLDDSDQAGALGYHEMTQNGKPMGKVFVASDIQYNESWSVTSSHELMEMLADPLINLTVFAQNANDNGGTLYAYENCDAVEDQQYAYEINGVLVSDFVTPHWFEQWRTAHSARFDFKGHVSMPFQILTGGYIGYMQMGSTTGWQQETAEQVPGYKVEPAVGTRRERRKNPLRKRNSVV